MPPRLYVAYTYRCFEKGCPKEVTKRMRQCQKVLRVVFVDRSSRCFSRIEGSHEYMHFCNVVSLSFALKHRKPRSSNGGLPLLIKPFSVVAHSYACVGQPLSKQLWPYEIDSVITNIARDFIFTSIVIVIISGTTLIISEFTSPNCLKTGQNR